MGRLAEASDMTLQGTIEQSRRDMAILEELIADPRRLGPYYQPIQRLSDGTLVGYKATGRGDAGTQLADTLTLLSVSRANGLVERLDWAFRCLAFDDLTSGKGSTVGPATLFITPEPETYGSMCPPRLTSSLSRARRELVVVAEIPAEVYPDVDRVCAAVAEFRSYGWQIATRDQADVSGGLDLLGRIRPDVVQVDLSRPGRVPGTSHAGVTRLLAWAASAGAQVMATDVDSIERHDVARSLGATLVRGFFVGEPRTF